MLLKYPVSMFVGSMVMLLPGCGTDRSAEDAASVTLALKGSSSALVDAVLDGSSSGAVKAAVVTIEQIYLQPAEGSGGERIVLRDQPVTTDLLMLERSTADLVRGESIPPGRYSELRFVISGAYIDVAGKGIFATPGYDEVPSSASVIGTLKTPSFDTSGFKIKLPSDDLFDGPGLHEIVLVRFDVAESFGHEAGSSGSWVMHPVIEAQAVESTSRIVLQLDARTVDNLSGAIDRDPWLAVLWDGAGFVEVAAKINPGQEMGRYFVEFPLLFAEEGPYGITLQTTGGSTLIIDPPLSDISLSASQDLTVRATAVAIAP
jgi:hypothetical protein